MGVLRFHLIATVAVGLALTLSVACGRAPASTPQSSPQASSQASAPSVAKPTGELRIARSTWAAEALDPTLVSAGAKSYLALIYDSLVGVTPDAKLSTETGLAEKWEASPDKKTWTFNIRKGVKFHNGDELTAEDVKFSIERMIGEKSVASFAATLRELVDTVETPDSHTVVISLKKSYGFLDYLLSNLSGNEGKVTPKKYIQEKGESFFNTNAVGTGPYRFVKQVTGSSIELEAVDDHWSGVVPKFKKLTLLLVPEESTRIAMLKTNEADVIELSRGRVNEMSGYDIHRRDGSVFSAVRLNSTWDNDTYLGDKRVREALSLAINREEMLQAIFAGQGEMTGGSAYYWGPEVAGYDKPLPLYPYDPEKAKQLLAEAFPGGVSLDLYLYPSTQMAEYRMVGEVVAGYWEKVGVKTKLNPVDYAAYRTKLSNEELPNSAAIIGGGYMTFPTTSWRTIWHSDGLLTGTKDPKLDAMIQAVEGSSDVKEFGERASSMVQYMRENHYTIPLFDLGEVYAANPQKVKDWNLGRVTSDINIPAGLK